MGEGEGWSDEEYGWLGRVSEANISAGVREQAFRFCYFLLLNKTYWIFNSFSIIQER